MESGSFGVRGRREQGRKEGCREEGGFILLFNSNMFFLAYAICHLTLKLSILSFPCT